MLYIGIAKLVILCYSFVMNKNSNNFPILSPNTVMANALDDPIDIILSRMALAPNPPKSVSFNVGTQINGIPHIGTYLVQAMAFHLAQKTREKTGVSTRVAFGALDNAPFEIKKNLQGQSFQRTYRDALGDAEIYKLIDTYYAPYFRDLSKYTQVPFDIQTYSEQQSTPEYREEFLKILPKLSRLGIALNPSQKQFKIRLPHPQNKFTEKHANHTKLLEFGNDKAIFESLGYIGDTYTSEVTANNGDETYLDINTLGRNLIKELVCMRNGDEMSVMVKGGDWMLGSTIVDVGLGIAGKRADEIPPRVYAPQIVTPDGAKLSKSLINNGQQNSNDIPNYFIDMGLLTELYPNVAEKMLDMCSIFSSDAKHLFRSYSYKEMDRLLGTDPRFFMGVRGLQPNKTKSIFTREQE
jgi:hypothetical protein